MAVKFSTYLDVMQHLQSERVAVSIAKMHRLDPQDKSFMELYKATLRDTAKDMAQANISPGQPIDRDAANNLLKGFVYVLMAKYGAQQHMKAKKQMYATDSSGWVTPMDASLNEAEDDWTQSDKNELMRQFKKGGYVGRVKQAYLRENPDASDRDFHKAFVFAAEIAFQQIHKYEQPPLMPSDMDDLVDSVIELVLSFEPAKSIFFSDPSMKKRKPQVSKDAGDDPFEKGSFADIGLNEGVGDWTQSKLDQHIKKEVEKLLKKGDYVSKKDVKDMIRKTIVKQYKYLWEKSAFFINQI